MFEHFQLVYMKIISALSQAHSLNCIIPPLDGIAVERLAMIYDPYQSEAYRRGFFRQDMHVDSLSARL